MGGGQLAYSSQTDPISLVGLMGVVWELYGRLPIYSTAHLSRDLNVVPEFIWKACFSVVRSSGTNELGQKIETYPTAVDRELQLEMKR